MIKGMGYSMVARYLNQNGYTRESAKNAVNPKFNDWKADQIKRMLDNTSLYRKDSMGQKKDRKSTVNKQ